MTSNTSRSVKVVLLVFVASLLVFNLLVYTEYSDVHNDDHTISHLYESNYSSPIDINNSTSSNESVSNIFLVKIHKAGSTTLQNILYRYGVRNQLKMAVFDRDFGMPFPDIARPEYLFEDIQDPDFIPYNLVVDHAVYSNEYPYKYMQPGVVTIGSIREPMSYLKSAFSFFKLQKAFHLQKSKNPVRDFLFYGPETFHASYAHAYNWTKNLQLFSFGYTERSDNKPEHIMNFIKTEIEPNIDYMLTLDKFDEGLILLKRKLNWSIKDIVYKVLWSTSKSKKMPTQTDTDIIHRMIDLYKGFSLGDYLLYDYYTEKINAEIQAQDTTFQQEVEAYRETNRQISRFCDTVCNHFNRSSMQHIPKRNILKFLQHSLNVKSNDFHDGFDWTFADCAMMGFFTFDFQMAIRVHQFPKVCKGTRGEPKKSVWEAPSQRAYRNSWCDKKSHVIYSFPWNMLLHTFLKTCHKIYS